MRRDIGQRYERWGDLKKFAEAYSCETQLTLQNVALQIGVSRETVRQDLIRELGLSEYASMLARRSAENRRPEPKEYRIDKGAEGGSAIRMGIALHAQPRGRGTAHEQG